MPFCPKCGDGYREGFTTCADCGVPLLDALPEKPDVSPETLGEPQGGSEEGAPCAMKKTLLTTVYGSVQAEMIVGLLRDNGIPAYAKDREPSGGIVTAYAGYSVFGKDIYVDEGDYEAAQRLKQGMTVPGEELSKEQEEVYEALGKKTRKRAWVLFLLSGPVWLILLAVGLPLLAMALFGLLG